MLTTWLAVAHGGPHGAPIPEYIPPEWSASSTHIAVVERLSCEGVLPSEESVRAEFGVEHVSEVIETLREEPRKWRCSVADADFIKGQHEGQIQFELERHFYSRAGFGPATGGPYLLWLTRDGETFSLTTNTSTLRLSNGEAFFGRKHVVAADRGRLWVIQKPNTIPEDLSIDEVLAAKTNPVAADALNAKFAALQLAAKVEGAEWNVVLNFIRTESAASSPSNGTEQ